MSRRSKYDSSGGALASSAQAQDISPGPDPGGGIERNPDIEFAGVMPPRRGGAGKHPNLPVVQNNPFNFKVQPPQLQGPFANSLLAQGLAKITGVVPGGIRQKAADKAITYFYNLENLDREKYPRTKPGYDKYMKERMAGTIDAYGNPIGGNPLVGGLRDDPNYIYLDEDMEIDTPEGIIDDEEVVEEGGGGGGVADTVYPYEFYGQPDYETSSTFESYLARGGRVPAAFGGIMDTETGRRGYFLGSIKKAVKGVAKAAGKVLRSPIGLAAAGYFLGGGGIGSFQGWGKKGFGKSPLAMSRFFQKNIAKKGMPFKPGGFDYLKAFTTLSPALAFTSLADAPKQETLGGAGGGGKLVDPLTNKEASPREMIASLNEAIDNADGDPDKIAAIKAAYRFLPPIQKLGQHGGVYPYEVKDGGRIGFSEGGWEAEWDEIYEDYKLKQIKLGKEYVSKEEFIDMHRDNNAQGGRIRAQEGGLMDLGGMEKDYRNNGGFVAIGGEERADDVPARLSRNEFVFTADAVRGAGGGDIDKGAEIMENVMKNLEQGGKMSEESQGNAGAQEMFSVSERIGEVL